MRTVILEIRCLSEEILGSGKVSGQLEQLSYHDALTGAPTEDILNKMLNDALLEADVGQLAVMFADLDNFKQINDTLGHDAGDELLSSICEEAELVFKNTRFWPEWVVTEFVFVPSN